MRRIDARRKKASALRLRFSQSLASLRQRLSQTAIEPSDRPLDDPAFWYDLEADGIVGSLDDFDLEMRKNFCQGVCELRSLIPTVGKEFLQEGK